MSSRYRAFTLIEILMSIAIIALLAGIVYAALGPVRERARQTLCVSNLHQIGLAVAMYRSDYDGIDATEGTPLQYWQAGLPSTMSVLYRSHIKDRAVIRCPNYHGPIPEEKMLSTYSWIPDEDANYPSGYKFSEVTEKRGMETPIVTDDQHNPPYDIADEPRWVQIRVLVLRLSQQIQTRLVPIRSTFPSW